MGEYYRGKGTTESPPGHREGQERVRLFAPPSPAAAPGLTVLKWLSCRRKLVRPSCSIRAGGLLVSGHRGSVLDGEPTAWALSRPLLSRAAHRREGRTCDLCFFLQWRS